MSDIVIHLDVTWQPPRWWSRYEHGFVTMGIGALDTIKEVWRHARTGEIRVYTYRRGWPLDGAAVVVNASEPVTLRKRGWYGKLHIGEQHKGGME